VVFSSLIFLLFLFLALVVMNFFCQDLRKKNLALLVFSLVFFAWGGLKYVVLLPLLAAWNWYGANRIAGLRSHAQQKQWLTITVAVDVVVFALFRFGRLLPWAAAENDAARYLMPMGLAFYLLLLIRYVVEVYRGTVKAQPTYWKVLLYAGCFLYTAGGPLVSYPQISREYAKRKAKSSEVSQGIMRFSCGLAKKAVLANSCGAAADALLGGSAEIVAAVPALGIWLGGIFYLLQVYLDLSAYADMAIGLGLLLGFHLPENFDYPYLSSSLTQFWRRWNITVVGFFREYVYEPLGGNRRGEMMTVVNLVITWLIFGLWHGSYPNDLLWAIYFLVLLLVERRFGHVLEELPHAVAHIWVLFTVFLGFFLFRFTDLGTLGTALKGLIGLNHNGFASAAVGSLFLHHIPLLVVAILACTPIWSLLGAIWKNLGRDNRSWFYTKEIWNVICPLLLIILSVTALVGNEVGSFLYFQL
jgi:alginate O-acetyltransferase complex protein AlgI